MQQTSCSFSSGTSAYRHVCLLDHFHFHVPTSERRIREMLVGRGFCFFEKLYVATAHQDFFGPEVSWAKVPSSSEFIRCLTYQAVPSDIWMYRTHTEGAVWSPNPSTSVCRMHLRLPYVLGRFPMLFLVRTSLISLHQIVIHEQLLHLDVASLSTLQCRMLITLTASCQF